MRPRQRRALITYPLFLQSILLPTVVAQTAFFEGDGTRRFLSNHALQQPQNDISSPGTANIDTDQIIYPILRPLMKAIDIMHQNAKALEYADKVEKERRESVITSPKSLFDLLRLANPLTTTTTTTPKPLIERLFEPFIGSIRDEINRLSEESKKSPTEKPVKAAAPQNDGLLGQLFSPPTLFNNDGVRRSEARAPTAVASEPPTASIVNEKPILSLLESLGHNAARREEVQVGRDRTVSVLGMPVGRRDGLTLSPLKGLSYGNQDMYGPIAVNDKYSVNWGFVDKLGTLLTDTSARILTGMTH